MARHGFVSFRSCGLIRSSRSICYAPLEECLVPKLQPGDVIVIDNASFHHSQTIDEIVAEAGCQIWYLPPYSPDLNKIEHWWFVLKNWMRQRWDEFDNFRDCVDAAFKLCPNVYP
jgi:transposase